MGRNTRGRGIFSAVLFSGFVSSTAGPALAGEAGAKWAPWLEAGGFASSERSRGEVNAFAPLYQNETGLLFADIKGKLFTESAKEGNFALGYRQMTDFGWNLGIWAGYDLRESEYNNTFKQVSFGMEALSADYDIRLNGYVPLSDPAGANGLAQIQISGSQIFMTGGQEVPLGGVDGEVGWRVPIETFLNDTAHHEMRVYAGGFYFNDDLIDKAVAGPRLRAEWRLLDFVEELPGMRLTFESEYQHDDYRGDQVEAGVRLRIPLFGSPRSQRLTPQESRMVEALERDTDIVTAGRKREAVADAATGVQLTNVETIDGNDDLTTASANAGTGTLILLDGAAGVIRGSNIITASGQTLAGGGGQLALRGLTSGQIATVTLPGAPATLMTDGCFCGDILTLDGSNDIHVAGVTLDGDMGVAGAGVALGSGQTNIHLTDIAALDLSGPGVAMMDGNDVTMDGLTVLQNGYSGIFALNGNKITLRNAVFRDLDAMGIEIDTGNTLVLQNVEIDNTVFGPGIAAFEDNIITGENISVSRTGQDALAMLDDNTVSLSGFTGEEIGGAVLYMEDGNSVEISGMRFQNINGNGVYALTNNTVHLTEMDLSGMFGSGLLIGLDNTVSVRESRIADTGFDGIFLAQDNALTVEGVTFEGAIGGNLFSFGGTGNSITQSTGNVNSTTAIGGVVCDVSGGGFTGTLEFEDGTVLQNGVAPCL